MAGCIACGGNEFFRKELVYDVGTGSSSHMVKKRKEKFLPCTLDVCGNCGHLTTYVQDPRDWAKRVKAEEITAT